MLTNPIRVSLSFMLLLFITTSAQTPIYMNSFCDNSTLVSSSYKANVDTLFSWLLTDSYESDGYNYTSVNSNNHNNDDAVYGLYSCRYDITGYFCRFCINSASSELTRRCSSSVGAIIWYDICIIRFTNQSFSGQVSLSPIWNTTGTRKIKDSSEVKKTEDCMEGLIRKATVVTKTYWAVDEFDWVDNEKKIWLGAVRQRKRVRKDTMQFDEESLNGDIPTIPSTAVLHCSNNFSEAARGRWIWACLQDEEKRKQLDWKLRLSTINGIAKDPEMNPKISDFGFARTFEIGQNQTKTKRVVDT
ncbi:hypothetical protein LR48_Vigan08g028800 [Vigna angularis]|uniref:Gnk2-homologous domain-containing protein n=1 Tax=Phaseolus angularis TaxID=3914 RepID=A0A0L9V3E1_PHAAN|nr:hypothetical protein LR48_Vigan08g028800 [Vigna angularis]